MGRLTTHVLNIADGIPAAGMALSLLRLQGGERILLLQGMTNADGRLDQPLLEGAACCPGSYELLFEAGAYFAGLGKSLPEPRFVEQVVLRFGIADAGQHYHVPLLVSPWSWSTYRGS